MEYTNITIDNIANEHLCCAIADKKHKDGVENKKEWIKQRIEEGHVFRKLNANAKVFIEYAPLESAWVPIIGDNYIYIYCLWVAGSYKGKGHGRELLNYAINDAKEQKKSGVCVLTSKKKKPFLSEKDFFIKHGFKVVDTVGEYELLVLSFDDTYPKFNDTVKKMQIDKEGIVIYYTDQCPYIANCVKEIEEYAKETQIKLQMIKVDTLDKAKNMNCIFNNWAVFKNGNFVSNTLLNRNSFEKMVNEK